MFTDCDEILIPFYESKDKGFFISYLGFHNFEHIKPVKYFYVKDCYTIHIILSGSGILKLEDKEYKVHEGDMFFTPPDVNLCYYPDDDNLWKYAWFQFEGKRSELYRGEFGFSNTRPVIKCEDFKNTYLVLDRIFTSKLKNKTVGYYDVLSAFYKLLDINMKKVVGTTSKLSDSVIEYINCHYSKTTLEISQLCSYFNVSHSYLCRVFKAENNCTVKEYLIKTRLGEACRLLRTSDLGIKEIAYSVGYSDDIHFLKSFKQHIGISPSEYRREKLKILT